MDSTLKLPRKVLVAGGGVSGRGCAAILAELGTDVTVADGNATTRKQLADDLGVAAIAPEDVDFAASSYDLVVTSPGWRPNSPLLAAASAARLEVIGDVELAWRLDRAEVFGPNRTWLVVTGTNGKTTTTGMLAAMMQANEAETGLRASAAGNIGVSLFTALAATPRVDVLCVELSSFQLHWSSTLRPRVGTVLNLAEDHIDWHGSFDAYARDKAKAFLGEVAVIGQDDPHVVQAAIDIRPRGIVTSFTAGEPQDGGVGVIDNDIVVGNPPTRLASAQGIEPAGIAGVLDACAAAAVAHAAGASTESISAGLAAYRVDAHRGEVVHEADGVKFIDNSKATNPHAVEAALAGLSDVIWIAGGQLKGAEVDDLVEKHHLALKAAVLLGQDREILAAALKEHAPELPVVLIEDTDGEEAMQRTVAAALQHAEAGDTVLLAPAAASLDMYSGMSQRGDLFALNARKLTQGEELKQ
ncbi:UDP-N-acetylmuramoyl-L-alanine--D-glutamate ligase [Corynebacterium casei]|uniref:UDP-N-acetylmuramoyl-L-alanine--D-glutamate ligase n=1 Tax=Corynebacterium casei TaxID=160386 RepID=UPI0026472D6D|nr:UDP-N-acetylmuramoyl-L-alanine--D-glutamate ligase [Corynebacterium casei]MDN5728584.1 UDP-N-acetylmuramoyl-L-alanine--D-glutamate ligase [Corynebacterium casei]MDN5740019.1 UDP-N-acetylmuramoyl-L-alanine--D-glutamate ligase [Corynebacterium casei]MDN5840075.1 UDP-N-acetylmuramoyl-L-alanine--D-glutamate ligase [Corynebacterium casei]MDN5883128.1 UDP-N-acetylmuramoyl-L-alanine--D-glutamate ligase [Corynebacterium casei]MDN5903880.1 UDP-N-acetylmuramoyl-L-alanine--D-glutamate ligase [Coryneba